MSHPENDQPLWTESRVESLLEDFFRKEMPQALRSSNPAPPSAFPFSTAQAPAARTQTAKRRADSFAGLAMVGFTSLLMLMLAVIVWNHSSGPTSETHSTSQGSSSIRSEPTRENDPLKQTSEGPIEMRSRIQDVTTDPISNDKPVFPELDIEVYPLDRESPVDESEKPRPANPERAPMPEESRQLPESTPAPSADPDEARLDSVFPELGGLS